MLTLVTIPKLIKFALCQRVHKNEWLEQECATPIEAHNLDKIIKNKTLVTWSTTMGCECTVASYGGAQV